MYDCACFSACCKQEVIAMNHGTWDKIRVVQYGCGKMGRIIMRYLLEQGAQIVGAIDGNDSLADRDIGEIMGLDQPTGIKIKQDTSPSWNASPGASA